MFAIKQKFASFNTVAVLLTFTVAGCKGASTSPTRDTPDLTGTWQGSIDTREFAMAIRWTGTQTGNSVRGQSAFTLTPDLPAAVGTLNGGFSGGQVTLSFDYPPEGFPRFAGMCGVLVSGTSDAVSAAALHAERVTITIGSGCTAYFATLAGTRVQGTFQFTKTP